VSEPPLELRAFSPETWPAFRQIHCDENGAGWCQCVAWWVETWEEFKGRSAAENLAHRRALCRAGEYDGYLLFAGDDPLAWCQVGPRDRLVKLRRQYALEPDPAAFAITCLPAARFAGLVACGDTKCARTGPREPQRSFTTPEGLSSRFRIVAARRRQGLARSLLERVLAELRRAGVARVEAFPKRGADLSPLDLWPGPEALYREFGFEVWRDDPARPVLRLDLLGAA